MSQLDAAIKTLKEDLNEFASEFGSHPDAERTKSCSLAIRILEAAAKVVESAGGHGKEQALSLFDAMNISGGVVRAYVTTLPDAPQTDEPGKEKP